MALTFLHFQFQAGAFGLPCLLTLQFLIRWRSSREASFQTGPRAIDAPTRRESAWANFARRDSGAPRSHLRAANAENKSLGDIKPGISRAGTRTRIPFEPRRTNASLPLALAAGIGRAGVLRVPPRVPDGRSHGLGAAFSKVTVASVPCNDHLQSK